MISPRTRRVLRGIAIGLLATFVVLVNVVAAALLYIGSDRGRERIVAYAVRQLQPVFPGGFEIGSSAGRLPWHLVLKDVVVRDLDERPAVEVDRVELGVSLLPLLYTRVQIDELRVDGASVVQQPLHDGRDNLATMAVIDKPLPAPPRMIPVSIWVKSGDFDTRFSSTQATAHATTHFVASLSHGMVATLHSLVLSFDTPARASVTASGAVHITKDPRDMDVRHAFVRIDGDTTELRRHVEKLELSGPATIIVQANGPAQDLTASVTAETTSPRVNLRAATHVWKDRAELETLEVRSQFASVDARGTYRFDRTGDGTLRVEASDLRPLALFGAPAMNGAVKITGEASHDNEHTKIALNGVVDRFRLANNRIEHALLDVSLADWSGKARIDATTLVLGPVEVRSAGLVADVSRQNAHVTARARGAEGIDLDLAADAEPRIRDNALAAVDATLARLRFRAGGTPWTLAKPAHAHVDLEQHDYAIDALDLTANQQHIGARGHVHERNIETAAVTVDHFDLSQLAGVLSPGHVLPHTDLNATVAAHGSFDEPYVNGAWNGTAHGRSERDFIHITTTGEGQLAHRRLNGKLFATIGGQKTSAKVDMPMPLAPDQPIDVSFDASVLLNPWFADVIVPKIIQSQPVILYSLGATVLIQGSVNGTTSNAHMNLGGRLRNWGAENGHGNAGLSVEYQAHKLAMSSTITFSSLPAGGGTGGGIVQATAELPFELERLLSGKGGALLDRDAAWHGDLKIRHVGIEHLPWKAFDVVPITSRGWVDGSVELSGTARHPKATAKVDGKGLNVSGVADIDVDGVGQLDDRSATLDVHGSLHDAEAFHIKGSIGAKQREWATAPMAFTVTSDGFDLGRLNVIEKLGGTLRARLEVTGNLQHPHVNGDVHATKLRMGAVMYDEARLGLAGAHVDLSVFEEKGGKLTAQLIRDEHGVAGTIEAEKMPFDIGSELLPRLRHVGGELDGKLTLAGTRRSPKVDGDLTLVRGELSLADSTARYREARAQVHATDNRLQITDLFARAGDDGTVRGHGTLTLDRISVQKLDGLAELHRFPLAWDTLTGLVDASIVFDGARVKAGALETKIDVERASVELTDDRGHAELLPTAHLEDVKVEPTRPLPEKPTVGRRGVDARAFIAGPVVVRSSGVDLPAVADLAVDFGTQIPLLTGRLMLTPHSQVAVFGHQYEIDHGAFTFKRSAQPQLDVVFARAAKDHRVGVSLAGPARQPLARFWAEPPDLDAAAVASLVTGQRAKKEWLDLKGLRDKVQGPLSELVFTALSQAAPNERHVLVVEKKPGE